MMQEGLKHFTEIPLTLLAMLLFFAIYLGAIAWTLWSKSNASVIERISNLPLHDEDASL